MTDEPTRATVDWGVVRHVELADGARLLVRSTEPEPTRPVLLVLARHGGNGLEFSSVAADLADHWCVVGVDLRGSGGSDWLPDEQGYSQQQWCRDVIEVLDRTGLEPTAAVGVSLGGMLIVDLHESGTVHLERAVVVDIAPEWPVPADHAAMAERMATNLRLLGGTYPDLHSITEAWRTVQADVWPNVDQHVIARSAAACTRETEEGWRFACDVAGYMMRAPGEPPILDRWAAWESLVDRVDTLVVRGEISELVADDAFERMIEGERASGLVVRGVGHWPPLELEPTRSAVADWLS